MDVRVISATNANLHEEVANRRFRQDLLFRLNTIEIHIPPCASGVKIFRPLASHFLGVHAQRYRKSAHRLRRSRYASADGARPWQGNVRELNHVVERAVLMAQDTLVRIRRSCAAHAAHTRLRGWKT